ncbi:hypothetical protein NSP_44320 [Nodularia spumigena CCY9414]|nr:hypothetical protein NSP_44320 [Nodularia spumigena CCY9414]
MGNGEIREWRMENWVSNLSPSFHYSLLPTPYSPLSSL